MTKRTWKDYQCFRCGINRGVKMYTFEQDGFLHQANLCMECASEGQILEFASEFLKKQRIENDKNISK